MVIFQSGIDGRYVRSFYPSGWLGSIFGFGLNLAIDIAASVLSYEFVRHQQDARKAGERTRLLAWSLLLGEFGLLYFALVFSHRQVELISPNEPAYLLWSMSAFAPVACCFIGVAQALRSGRFEKKNSKQIVSVKQVVPVVEIPIANVETSISIPIPPAFPCSYCDREFSTAKQRAGHMKAHPIKDRDTYQQTYLPVPSSSPTGGPTNGR